MLIFGTIPVLPLDCLNSKKDPYEFPYTWW